MTIDIERVRAETRGVSEATHLLAASSSLPPRPVVEAVIDHLRLEERIGGYEALRERADDLDGVYDEIAGLIGAGREEIAIAENASAAWAQAFYALRLQPGDRILTGRAEYAANYVAFLQRARRDGIEIDVVPNDGTGATDPEALEGMIGARTALIALTWIPTNGGLVNPAAEIGRIARRHGVPYLLDACQAAGQKRIDVGEIGCDFLSATGRKFLRGPRGTGFLYVRRNWLESGLEPVTIDHFAAPWVERDRYELRADARRFETWENAYALRAGLKAAAAYARQIGLDAIEARCGALAGRLRAMLAELPGAEIRDLGAEKCAIVSFTIAGLAPLETVDRLRERQIMIGASDPAGARLDSEARGLPTLLRAAPHYYNTEEELGRLVDALKQLR